MSAAAPPDEVLEALRRALPEFTARGAPAPLSGGLMNQVWRLPGAPRSLILKRFLDHAAAAPQVRLDPARVGFEARALRVAAQAWPGLAPGLVAVDEAAGWLVMEDLGDLPDLERALGQDLARPEALGATLGEALGRLHAETCQDPELARRHDNASVQRTRDEVQYRGVGPACARAGLPGAAQVEAAALALGQRFLGPGRCLVMGDLWPPSVLVDGERPRLIDWEFSHFGDPAQDLGHLAAHLFMLADRARDQAHRARVLTLRDAALAGWRRGAGALAPALLAGGVEDAARQHLGCEVLVRTVGAFHGGGPYRDLAPDDPGVLDAALAGVDHLLGARHDGLPALGPPAQAGR